MPIHRSRSLAAPAATLLVPAAAAQPPGPADEHDLDLERESLAAPTRPAVRCAGGEGYEISLDSGGAERAWQRAHPDGRHPRAERVRRRELGARPERDVSIYVDRTTPSASFRVGAAPR